MAAYNYHNRDAWRRLLGASHKTMKIKLLGLAAIVLSTGLVFAGQHGRKHTTTASTTTVQHGHGHKKHGQSTQNGTSHGAKGDQEGTPSTSPSPGPSPTEDADNDNDDAAIRLEARVYRLRIAEIQADAPVLRPDALIPLQPVL